MASISEFQITKPVSLITWGRRKPLPSASVQAKCGQPLTITILPYYKMWCVTNLRLCAIELQLEVSGAEYGCPPATLIKKHHWLIVKHGTDRKKERDKVQPLTLDCCCGQFCWWLWTLQSKKTFRLFQHFDAKYPPNIMIYIVCVYCMLYTHTHTHIQIEQYIYTHKLCKPKLLC